MSPTSYQAAPPRIKLSGTGLLPRSFAAVNPPLSPLWLMWRPMELATFRYANGRWSQPFPGLDSPTTMIVAFASPAFHGRPEVLEELARAFPQGTLVGCSTSGEIDQTSVRDDSI